MDRDLAALADRARQAGRDAGLDAVGIAPAEPFESTRQILHERSDAGLRADMEFTYRNPERSTDPSRILPNASALVVGARSYLRADAEEIAPRNRALSPRQEPGPRGRVARYAWRDHYRDLRDGLEAAAAVLVDAGFEARVVADDNALVDREAAVRAGLGWYGKNTNVLLGGSAPGRSGQGGRGSWFVLGSVVTDAALPADPPAEGGCGSCARCLPACPTGALIAPGVLDARRCLAWLVQAPGVFPRQHRVALGDRIYGCDDCQEACPANRLLDDSAAPAPEADAAPWLDLIGLLGADDNELMDTCGRWYIPNREPRYLRRNALVALGNVGNGRDPQTEATLMTYLTHADPLLRAHAAWSTTQLGRGDLLRVLADDEDPVVKEELSSRRGGQ